LFQFKKCRVVVRYAAWIADDEAGTAAHWRRIV
jgi:hypothetical protein